MRLTKIQAEAAIKELKEKLIGFFGDQIQLCLFGSVARGDFGPESDIDILVLLDQKVDFTVKDKIYDLAFEIELEHNLVFGLLIESKTEWTSPLFQAMPIHKEIDREGIPV